MSDNETPSTTPVPEADPPAEQTPSQQLSAPPRELQEPVTQPVTPRGDRKFGLIALLLAAAIPTPIAAIAGYTFAGRMSGSASATDATKAQYQCPMHPTVVQDHPGECPICGMKLVKLGGSTADPRNRKPIFYRSPMNPQQTSPTPQKDEMGMDYVPVYADEELDRSSAVEGLATVEIDSERQQLIGLKTADVTRGRVGGAWQTFSRVSIDERRVRHINVKVPVYVENVFVNFVGERVRRGQTLFSGYSPELLTAQAEYRVALSTQSALGGSTDAPLDRGIVKAARRRLELWDMPESAIKKLDNGGEPMRTLNFVSPIEGVVLKKEIVDGMKLSEGAMPYEIVDLSTVWVLADIYESDIHRVRLGMPGKLALKAYPNRTFEGVSTFVDPVLDPMTRTVKLRFSFPNPDGDLKPGMFGEITLENAARDGLRIPVDAVIDSGTTKVVFIALGEGKLQPREVQLGESDRSFVEVISGLSEGDKVVVRANFLVDSESRLRASLVTLTTTPPKDRSTPTVPSSASASASVGVWVATPSGARPKEATGVAAPKSSANAVPAAASSTAPAARYSCPMHPEVTDTVASRCPKCGMLLTTSEHGEHN